MTTKIIHRIVAEENIEINAPTDDAIITENIAKINITENIVTETPPETTTTTTTTTVSTSDAKLPINNAISAEDIEQQLREQQQGITKDKLEKETDINPTEDTSIIDEEDLDKYKPIHITPELKPDPREMVDEDLNIAPEWAADNNDAEEIINNDFQFGAVIDKEKDRQYIKQQGTLPETTATITHEEYERRKAIEKTAAATGPKKPPIPHGHEPFPFPKSTHSHSLRGTKQTSLRSQSTPYKSTACSTDALPIDKLPSRIRGIVVRLDEDIAKISTYIQQVQLEKDQLNRYQRHLHKLIARRGQYVNWWKAQQRKHQLDDGQKPNVSVGLRHTNSLQQLEHYKDYYNKQLDKMVISAQSDPKFNTYVEYYTQKLKAVEKRQHELESRQNVGTSNSPTDASNDANSKENGASIIEVMSGPSNDEAIKNAIKQQNEKKIQQPVPLTTNDNNDNDLGFLNLGDLGYSKATTSAQPAAPQTASKQSEFRSSTNHDEAMYQYFYGAQAQPSSRQSQNAPVAITPQRVESSSRTKNISQQKQKLKAKIRQHALKHVKPPPNTTDETYPQWYQGLRKVENIIYTKYMNKQRKRMEPQQQVTLNTHPSSTFGCINPQYPGPAAHHMTPPTQQQDMPLNIPSESHEHPPYNQQPQNQPPQAPHVTQAGSVPNQYNKSPQHHSNHVPTHPNIHHSSPPQQPTLNQQSPPITHTLPPVLKSHATHQQSLNLPPMNPYYNTNTSPLTAQNQHRYNDQRYNRMYVKTQQQSPPNPNTVNTYNTQPLQNNQPIYPHTQYQYYQDINDQ